MNCNNVTEKLPENGTSGILARAAAFWLGGNGGGRVQLPRHNNGILILAWKTAKDKEWLSSGWLEDKKKKGGEKKAVWKNILM